MTQKPTRREALKSIGAGGAAFLVSGGVIRGQGSDITIAGQPVEIAVSSESPLTARITIRPIASGQPATLVVTGALAKPDTAPVRAAARCPAPPASRPEIWSCATRQIRRRVHVETSSGTAVQKLDARRRRTRHVVPAAEGTAARSRRRRRAVRQEGLDRSDAQRPGDVAGRRLPAGDPRHARADPVADRHRTAGRCSSTSPTARSTSKEPKASSLPPAANGAAARRVRRQLTRPARHHARVRAHHRTAGDAAAVDVRLHAVASHARRPRRDPRRRADVPREEAAVRHADLSRHRVRAVGMEHAQRRVHLAPDELSRPEEDARPASRGSLQGHRARGHRRPAVHRRRQRSVHGARAAARPDRRQSVAARSAGRPATGRCTRRSWTSGVDGWWPDQGDGFDGPSRLAASSHVLGRHAAASGRTSGRSRCTATRRQASNASADSSGRATCSRAGKRWRHTSASRSTPASPVCPTGARTSAASSDDGVHRRAARALVSVRRVLSRASARTDATGISSCRGAGTAATAVRSRPPTSTSPPEELKNARVEPICRKYLELRYQLMPYLHTAIRECHDTGLPIMRALWLHHPDDRDGGRARRRVPVGPRHPGRAGRADRARRSRKVYLPRGTWFDFWTNERARRAAAKSSARSISRRCRSMSAPAPSCRSDPSSSTSTSRSTSPPPWWSIPAPTASSPLYEDDGRTFAYRQGRVDAHQHGLAGWGADADAAAGARFADAAAGAAAVHGPSGRLIGGPAGDVHAVNR